VAWVLSYEQEQEQEQKQQDEQDEKQHEQGETEQPQQTTAPFAKDLNKAIEAASFRLLVGPGGGSARLRTMTID
jgi:dGTP triphosphohydrolase